MKKMCNTIFNFMSKTIVDVNINTVKRGELEDISTVADWDSMGLVVTQTRGRTF